MRKVLLIHQNFPGQFLHLARYLAQHSDYDVRAVCQPHAPKLEGIQTYQYQPSRHPDPKTHHYNRPLEAHTLTGQAVYKLLTQLKSSDYVPDVVIAHAGWGEALYVKDVYPDTKLIGFFEFFYHAKGADVGFDPEFPITVDDVLRIRNKNATHLLTLNAVDAGICPTLWQKSTFPPEYQSKLHLIHEGIHTEVAAPNPEASYTLPNGTRLTCKDEVVTYIARNMEPYRGIHQAMRAFESVCKQRQNAHILIIGADGISYGRPPQEGGTWRHKLLKEVTLDLNRVHFLGQLTYVDYLKVLQISSAHLYLTVPFVLSWSMLEAMSAECLVIGSDTAPVTEVLKHNKNGLLVDFFNPQQIADTICEALANPKHYTKLRRAARKTILQKYNLGAGVSQYIELINRLF